MIEEYINKKYNRLTIISIAPKKWKNKHVRVFCKCDCGNEIDSRLYDVVHNNTKSCGCLRSENGYLHRYNTRTHGMTNTRFYDLYGWIKERCNNQNNNKYNLYGGRGIECLWNTFEEFKNDMYELYLEHEKIYGTKQTTIDRINSNGNYCKKNCRWATYKEQNLNRNICQEQINKG